MSKSSDGRRLRKLIAKEQKSTGVSPEQITPFTVNGTTVYVRVIPPHALADLALWRRANPGDNSALMCRYIAAGVVDADCKPLLTVDDVSELDGATANALADEVVRVNGI